MKQISINNGASFVDPKEAIKGMDWDVIVNMMDDDTREEVAAEGHDTEEEFLSRYLEIAPCDLIIG